MIEPENKDKSSAQAPQADNNSIAIGRIEVGGDVSGNITIGNTGYTADEVSVLISQITATFQPRPFDGRCPYKGLDVFEEEDAELFFGREKLVDDLVSRVKDSRTVFVTGPSGSGKSSLVRAGLIHALKQGAIKNSERWLYATMKPGRDPIGELGRVASSLAGSTNAEDEIRAKAMGDATIFARWCEIALKEGRDKRVVLFIDQFEEVFTQINSEAERVAFLNLLTHAATVENGRVIVLFSMRSDFVSNCATYPQLNAILNQQFVQIGAMQPEELVSAIAQPALRVGLRIDPDLIAQIINEMKGEPGALPLMQFALKDLFDSQQEKSGIIALTLNDYLQRGGIHKALERHADDSFSKLSSNEQELARSIFSGLIEIGRGTQDTRRTALFDELIPAHTKAEHIEAIIQKLADARLITTDEQAGNDTVTISHEKLIDAWPWLKKLVNENRDVIALQNEISADAKEWEEHHRDASYLYSGARLINARKQLETKKLILSELAQKFVQVSRARHQRGQVALVAGISTIMVLLVLAVFVFRQQSNSNAQLAQQAQAASTLAFDNAATAQANADEADHQTQIARARELAAKAQLIVDSDPQLALLFSIESLRLHHTLEADTVIRKEINLFPELIMNIKGFSLGFSPDSKIFVSHDDADTIHFWHLDTKQQIASISIDQSQFMGHIQISPDNRLLVIDNSRIWDIRSGREVFSEITNTAYFILNPDGKLIATAGKDGTLQLWDSETGKQVTQMQHGTTIDRIVFSPDGNKVVSISLDGKTNLWDVKSAGLVSSLGNGRTVVNVLFSPESKLLYVDDVDGVARMFNIQTGVEIARKNFMPPIQQVIINEGAIGILASDAAYLWFGSSTQKIIDIKDEHIKGLTFMKETVSSIYSPSYTIAIWSWDKLQTWNPVYGFGNVINDSLAFGQLSADGTHFAVPEEIFYSYPPNNYIRIVDTRTGEAKTAFTNAKIPIYFSDDGNWMSAENDLWRLNSPNYIQQVSSDQNLFDLNSPAIEYSRFQMGGMADGNIPLAYSCDENTGSISIKNTDTGFDFASKSEVENFRCPAIAVSSNFEWIALGWDDHVTVWDIYKQEKIKELDFSGGSDPNLISPGIYSIAFSADNSRLIAGGLDIATVWDTEIWQKKLYLNFGAQEGQFVLNVALSQDGLWAVTTFYPLAPTVIQIWNVETGQEVSKIENEKILSASFVGLDDKYLKTADENGAIKLRLWKAEDLIQEGCAHAIRNFTSYEWDLYMNDELYRATCPQWPLEPEATKMPTAIP